jgi:hypothetical protein
VPGHDPDILFSISYFVASEPTNLFAYGPAPQMELIPYFLSLLAWMGLSFGAILLWPISRFLRHFRKAKDAPKANLESNPIGDAVVDPQNDAARDGVK